MVTEEIGSPASIDTFILSFIYHSTNVYEATTRPGTGLGAIDPAVNKTDRTPSSYGC